MVYTSILHFRDDFFEKYLFRYSFRRAVIVAAAPPRIICLVSEPVDENIH